MKRYLSVFEMITRCSIYKVLGLLLAMVIAESIALGIAWNQQLAVYQPNLEEWIDQSYILIVFGIAFFLLTKVLTSTGTNVGSMQGYTLQRLRIKESEVHKLQCVYNILAYVLLWMTQLVVFLVAATFYMNYKSNAVLTNQTVFLAFYRNEFMHSILPLGDVVSWFLLFFFIVVTGILTARFSRMQRSGQTAWSVVVILVMSVFCFPRALGEEPVFILIGTFIWSVFLVLQGILNKEAKENES